MKFMPSIVTAINGITFIACNELAFKNLNTKLATLRFGGDVCGKSGAQFILCVSKTVDGIAYDDAQLLVAIQKFENKSSL